MINDARSAESKQEWSMAIKCWEKVLDEMGKKAPLFAYSGLANAYMKQNQYQDAENILIGGLKEYPDDENLLNAYASLKNLCIKTEHALNTLPEASTNSRCRNVSDVCECFWYVEEKLHLPTWKVNDVFVWPLIRMQLYYNIAQKIGLYDAPHPTYKKYSNSLEINSATIEALSRVNSIRPIENKKIKNSLKSIYRKCKVYLSSPQSLITRNKKTNDPKPVVLMATRKLNGSEPYTEALRSELKDTALLLDRPLSVELVSGAINFDVLTQEFKSNYKCKKSNIVSSEDRLICEEIRQIFLDRLAYDLGDLALKCRQTVVTFNALRRGFEAFWQAYPVSTLYITHGYGINIRAALATAKQKGANIVELQHGFISKYHLGYSWPTRIDIPYSPDELWCFGDYWAEVTPLAGNVKAKTIGAPYLKQLTKMVKVERQSDLVVFASQGVIGKRLVQIAIETARRRKDKTIIFRLHPSEVYEDYEQLIQKLDPLPSNFSISHREPVIFELLSQASIQVGAFSTTLLEGMSLGTRTIVVNLPGVEYMMPVIERNDALFVENIDELVDKLDDAILAQDPYHYYAEPVTPLV